MKIGLIWKVKVTAASTVTITATVKKDGGDATKYDDNTEIAQLVRGIKEIKTIVNGGVDGTEGIRTLLTQHATLLARSLEGISKMAPRGRPLTPVTADSFIAELALRALAPATDNEQTEKAPAGETYSQSMEKERASEERPRATRTAEDTGVVARFSSSSTLEDLPPTLLHLRKVLCLCAGTKSA
ncbi:hypothetical protein ERJ75_001698900 [Trypanosoma vivax]|nr:hypothetical protein ERJ75_001698900 [Trypanosoma vivax]